MAMKNHLRINKTTFFRFVKLRWGLKNFKSIKKFFENGQIRKIMKKNFLGNSPNRLKITEKAEKSKF